LVLEFLKTRLLWALGKLLKDPGSSLSLISRLLQEQGARHWRGYVFAFCCMATMAASTASSAWIMRDVIDKVFIEKNMVALWQIASFLIFISILKGMSAYGQQVALARVANAIVADIQRRVFDKMLCMTVGFFGSRHSTDFIARQSFIGQSASNALNLVITAFSRDSLTLIGLVSVMIFQDPFMSLLALVFMPVAVISSRKLGLRVRKVIMTEFTGFAQIMESMQEAVQGIRIVKAFTLEKHLSHRQGTAIMAFEDAANKLAAVSARSSPLMEALGGLAIALVVLYGGWSVIANDRAPGSFFSFITAVLLAYEPAKRLARLQVDLNGALVGVSMLYQFLDEKEVEPDIQEGPPLILTKGQIEFRNVVFSYRAEEPVLRGLSFVAEAGKMTALVGRSGGGKSTVMSLLLRYWDLEGGKILLDGQDIAAVSRMSLRRQLAYVSQDTYLFKGTIRDNIAIGKLGASDDEVIAAAKAAHAHDFIMKFDDGYDTQSGENGMQLSGGQRQRIAIARAFLKNAPILLLDEATSSLDTESERAVQDALGRLREGRTTIVIAHRLSTIRSADKICVVSEGRVLEEGEHRDLMKNGGVYALLAGTQTG
jgi:ATP-binding cassette subfamily B protein